MEEIEIDPWDGEVPKNYTGFVHKKGRGNFWYKNGNLHREDGPAAIYRHVVLSKWYLEGKLIWSSDTPLMDYKILSREPHLLYPTVEIWKYLDEGKVKDQIMIPGMYCWFTKYLISELVELKK